MAKIHIIFHITNIFSHQFAILWVICVGEGWGVFSEEEPHGLALVPYVGGVAYGAEAVKALKKSSFLKTKTKNAYDL